MKTNHAKTGEADDLYGPELGSATDRLLLYLLLVAGYAFLGFFGWLLTR